MLNRDHKLKKANPVIPPDGEVLTLIVSTNNSQRK